MPIKELDRTKGQAGAAVCNLFERMLCINLFFKTLHKIFVRIK